MLIPRFVILKPYLEENDTVIGVWDHRSEKYIFGDGDMYSAAEIDEAWDAQYFSWAEFEQYVAKPKRPAFGAFVVGFIAGLVIMFIWGVWVLQ